MISLVDKNYMFIRNVVVFQVNSWCEVFLVPVYTQIEVFLEDWGFYKDRSAPELQYKRDPCGKPTDSRVFQPHSPVCGQDISHHPRTTVILNPIIYYRYGEFFLNIVE